MIKKLLEEYISKNYNKLLKAAKYITKDDTAEDLLHDTLYYLLTREEYSKKIKEAKPNPNSDDNIPNYYNYIVRAMAIQYTSSNKSIKYNKQYKGSVKLNIDKLKNNIDEQYDTTYEDILNWIQNSDLFNSKIKNYYCKTIFFDYYYPEYQIEISGMTLGEIKEIRKTSHQKISKKYNISKSSVRNALKDVIEKIKIKYYENR